MGTELWGKDMLAGHLIGSLREVFGKLRDPRNGANRQYSFDDIAMSAFSAFFIQSPSFLDHQRVFHKASGKSACGSLFGIERLPTDNHIRKQLDRVDCADMYEGFDLALDMMKAHRGALRPYQVLGGHVLVALDGSEFHNSRKVHCDQCQTRVRNRGTEDEHTEYYHSVLAAVLVGPGHPYAVPLRPEFISPQDGDRKQDCETKAAYRWLARNAPRYADLRPIYLGDDLYAKQPMCTKVLGCGADFIFRVKTADHKTLFSYLDGIDWPNTTIIEKTPGRRPNRRFHYRWTHHTLPLTAEKNPLEVYYVDLHITDVGTNKKGNTFRFITSVQPTENNVADIVACGRTRWKAENEAFNLLKNQGYHVEHNFGHGSEGLSNTLLTLNLVAFAFHGACDQLCTLWKMARAQCSRRMRFFHALDMLTEYLYFDNWYDLLFMIASPQAYPIAKMRAPP